jgi:microcin C transport system permease protein
MLGYILKRITLIIPTLFVILLINFSIIQFAPGGPVERIITQLTFGEGSDNAEIINNSNLPHSNYEASKGLDPELIEGIKKQYGFDKPMHVRFFKMIKDFMLFDFGESFFKGKPVLDLIVERLPISLSLGLWSTLIIYFVSIPLGIKKAVRNGSAFDLKTNIIISVLYAIPAFLLSIMLIIFFGKGGMFSIFPISGLTSDNFSELSFWGKIKDYFMHIILPTISLVIGGFAALTVLTKNSFLSEIDKQYTITAKAKGLNEKRVLYGHVFRNAMILVVSQIPETLIKILFTGALLIEIIFSLEGLGLLAFEAAVSRDYPIIFATLYIYTLIGLVFNLVSDIMYALIDPRINFNKQ